jgi:hypothetical protein
MAVTLHVQLERYLNTEGAPRGLASHAAAPDRDTLKPARNVGRRPRKTCSDRKP